MQRFLKQNKNTTAVSGHNNVTHEDKPDFAEKWLLEKIEKF